MTRRRTGHPLRHALEVSIESSNFIHCKSPPTRWRVACTTRTRVYVYQDAYTRAALCGSAPCGVASRGAWRIPRLHYCASEAYRGSLRDKLFRRVDSFPIIVDRDDNRETVAGRLRDGSLTNRATSYNVRRTKHPFVITTSRSSNLRGLRKAVLASWCLRARGMIYSRYTSIAHEEPRR